MPPQRCLLLPLLALVLFFLPEKSPAENLISNGDFIKGADGWLWEQWENKPLPGKVQREGPSGQAFYMGATAAPGPRYLAKEVILGSDSDFLLKFSLRLDDVPANAARMRVMVPNVGFLKGGDLLTTGGTKDWADYSYPIPASELNGQRKIVLFFYHDHAETGTMGIADVELTESAAPASGTTAAPPPPASHSKSETLQLTGDTSKPVLSTFIEGETAELIFTVSGPIAKSSPLKLILDIVDEHGTKIDSKEISVEGDSNDRWIKKIPAPSSKLGFYRVYAKLSNEIKLRALGSRAEGFLTYAVVPDPAKRKLYGENETLFGMQGGFGPWVNEVLSYLGARWVLDSSLEWNKNEPDRAGQFLAADYKASPSPKETMSWQKYTLPTLFAAPKWAVIPESFAYMTGGLTPDGEKAWADYCKQAAQAYMAQNPNRASRLYQVTWEPITPWGYKGTAAQLARIFEIAYRVLHEVDPKAAVGGFTMGIVPEDIEQTTGVLKQGAGRHLDVITTHPYFSIEAERDGMIPAIRATKESVRKHAGREIPFVGTEQGYSTQEDPDKDIIHARGLLRQNLITLGEGFRFNFAYYIVDYRLGEQRGYGYYYNLVDGVPWGPAKAGPRPAAPAYAAQTLLLDGHKSAGAIEWLGDEAWGYAFEQPGDIVLALWDYGTKPKKVTIPVGAKQVRVYDWMGNERVEPAKQGNVTLTLGPEPLYVRDVAPTLWGSGAGKVLQVNSKSMQAYPGDKLTIGGTIVYDQEPPLNGKLVLEGDPRLGWGLATKEVVAKKGTPLTYAFDLSLPATVRPGSYAIKISANNDLGAYAVNGINLQILSPVALTHIQQIEEVNGIKGIGFDLKEMQGKGASGKVEVTLNGVANSAQTKEFKTTSGIATSLAFPYPSLVLDNAKTYQASITVTLDTGYTFQKSATVNFLTARRFEKPPTLDGNPAIWQSSPPALLGKPQLMRSAQYYRGDKDTSATLRYKWDDHALYIGAEVTDDLFRQDFEGTNIWKGDSLQLSINLDPHKEEMSTGNLLADDANRQRWSEFTVALTQNGPEAFRHLSFEPGKYPLGPVSEKEMKAVIKRDEVRKITFYEIAIPWKTLGLPESPKAGTTIGIAAAVNDMDEADQKDPSGLGLFGGIYPNKNVKKLGLLLLGEKP